jgi:hypothetical protein
MVKKLMTGLAISVGAGLALTFTTRAARKGARKGAWHPATHEGSMTPVTIRVNTAVSRKENAAPEDYGESVAPTTTPEHSVELAEIRVLVDALDNRSHEMLSTINQRIDDLQNQMPRFIDVKVTSRIREVEERLRIEFQDEQGRTLDAFLKTLEQKVLPRIALIEAAVGAQGEEIGCMRERIEKTDDTLDRVLERIEIVVSSMAATSLPGYNSHVMEINQKAVA